MYRPGDAVYWGFSTHAPSGQLIAADTTPTAVLTRNGVDTDVPVSVTGDDGSYMAFTTIPEDWIAGDTVQLRVQATVAGVTARDYSTCWALTTDNPDGAGTGIIPVTHDYGGTDMLRYVDEYGNGITDGIIQAFLTADWLAGRRGTANIKATVRTNHAGRWQREMMLYPNESYTLRFFKPGSYQPSIATLSTTGVQQPVLLPAPVPAIPAAVVVDHNYGGANALSFHDAQGHGIGDAIVQLFHPQDQGFNKPVAATRTSARGDWVTPVLLPPGTYVLRFTKTGITPIAVTLTVQ